ncbi:hypothetical protein BJV77DRAFT_969250, partial [Russula vinacea]
MERLVDITRGPIMRQYNMRHFWARVIGYPIILFTRQPAIHPRARRSLWALLLNTVNETLIFRPL